MTETPVADTEPTFQDDMQRTIFAKLTEDIKQRNALVSQLNAANGDRLSLSEELTENSQDPEIVAAREARDEAIMRLDALVGPKVKEMIENSAGSIDRLREQVAELDTTLKPGVNFYKKLYSDEAAAHLPKQVNARGVRVGNAGAGGRRIRGFNVVITVDGETEEYENFASAAKFLDVDTSDLQDAFFKAAGDPKSSKEAPDKVQFTATFTEVDEEENEVTKEANVYAYRTDAVDAEGQPITDEPAPEVHDEPTVTE